MTRIDWRIVAGISISIGAIVGNKLTNGSFCGTALGAVIGAVVFQKLFDQQEASSRLKTWNIQDREVSLLRKQGSLWYRVSTSWSSEEEPLQIGNRTIAIDEVVNHLDQWEVRVERDGTLYFVVIPYGYERPMNMTE